MDALAPFVDELSASGDAQKAAQAADAGAKNTKDMKASLGWTVYLGGGGCEEVTDPGAYEMSISIPVWPGRCTEVKSV